MANNSIPTSYDPIVQLLEDAADGAHTHGAAIGLVHNSETHIRTDLIALVGKPAGPGGVPPAVPGFKSLWNTAQTNKSTKTAALRTVQSRATPAFTSALASARSFPCWAKVGVPIGTPPGSPAVHWPCLTVRLLSFLLNTHPDTERRLQILREMAGSTVATDGRWLALIEPSKLQRFKEWALPAIATIIAVAVAILLIRDLLPS